MRLCRVSGAFLYISEREKHHLKTDGGGKMTFGARSGWKVGMRAGAILALVACVVGTFLAIPSSNNAISPGNDMDLVITHPPRVAAIGPIFINGSSATEGWDDCPWVNGSGTPADPYRIENYTLDTTAELYPGFMLPDTYGLKIVDSEAYFRVYNCSFIPYLDRSYAIYLDSVHNGSIGGNNCTNMFYGFYGLACQNITLQNNNFSSVTGAINLAGGGNCSVIENVCENDTTALQISWGHNISVFENKFNEGRGQTIIYLWNSANLTIEQNNCSLGQRGIYLENITDSRLALNNCSYNAQSGIEVYAYKPCQAVTITQNWLIRNAGGAIMDPGGFATAYDNFIADYPKAGIGAHHTAVMLGEAILFNDTSTGGEGALQYQWDFGDGTPNATTANVTHLFAAAGTYNVVMRVNDTAGYASVTNQTVFIRGPGWHIYYNPVANVKLDVVSGDCVAHVTFSTDYPFQIGLWVSGTNPVQALPASLGNYGRVFLTMTYNSTYALSTISLTIGYTGQFGRADWDPSTAKLWLYNPETGQWEDLGYVNAQGTGNDAEWNATAWHFPFWKYEAIYSGKEMLFCLTFDQAFHFNWFAFGIIAAVAVPIFIYAVIKHRQKQKLA